MEGCIRPNLGERGGCMRPWDESRDGPATASAFTLVARGRWFREYAIGGTVSLVLPLGIATIAMTHGVNPLALGWLMVIASFPSLLILAVAGWLSRSRIFKVDASGITVAHSRKTLMHIPWGQVVQVLSGRNQVQLRRKEHTGAFLVVVRKGGGGAYLNSLRHEITTQQVHNARDAVVGYAREYGVETIETDVLDRRLWKPLKPLRR